jgi:N-acetyl-gamma-glutamyl-phosphate reductase
VQVEASAPQLLEQAVYGLPEVNRDRIKQASLIASPGCYPTSILLPTIPLIRAGLVKTAGIIADSLSGVSGAGRKAELDYLFVECNESVRPYGVPKHRTFEIEQEIARGRRTGHDSPSPSHSSNRGILTTLYLAPEQHFTDAGHESRAKSRLLSTAYGGEPSCACSKARPSPTKNVAGTNAVEIAWRLDQTGRLVVERPRQSRQRAPAAKPFRA